MVMAVFAYIYHQSFVVPQSYSVEMILDQVIVLSQIGGITFYFHLFLSDSEFIIALQILMNLTFDEQQDLYRKLGQIFQERQIGRL